MLAGPKTPERGSFLQSQFAIERVAVALAGAFMPAPKVDSVVLRFTPRSEIIPFEELFFKIVRVGLTQPRKMLVNNLQGMQFSRERILSALAASDLTEKARPQELALGEWHRLTSNLKDST